MLKKVEDSVPPLTNISSTPEIIPTFKNEIYTPEEEAETFDIFEYFTIYNQIYYENLLGSITLEWSKKMTSCAGVFSVYKGIPKIRLSEPILKYRSINEIKETLLHEMIHAYCYIKKLDMSDDMSGHGKYFKQKMNEINKSTGLHISVYHSFHDEVDFYKKYVWRCDGKCREWGPHYGYVRRQMNRPPQKADPWWNEHKKKCGGTFIRISPTDEELKKQKNEKKKTTVKGKENKVKEKRKIKTIDDFISKNLDKETKGKDNKKRRKER